MAPTGTVTFLFTDIEGSTKLAQLYRDAWETLRKRQHAILRAAIEAHNGYIFQIIGDAVCSAFSTADDAVYAAVKSQIDLNAEKWGNDSSIKVRMGIHTGKADIQDDGDYHGYLTMSRVQRLMSAAHGGQVLLSLATEELVRDNLPENVSLRDVGEHRLKDIVQPERIYQLVIPGLPGDFPPLRTPQSFEHMPLTGLTVRLIGTFQIRFDNKPVILSSRVAQSLFAYLILNAGTVYRREKLAGMFWPEASEDKARTYLRNELWRIRKALPSNDYLIVDNIGIAFDSSTNYWLDATLLENLKNNASANELITALSGAQGELLPGFYEEWVTQEREHLQAMYEQKMARLLELLDHEKRWQEILEWGERWISLGQAPETAYRALMSAYEALGDQAKVMSTYERCVQALREWDLKPSEQTRALAFKRTSALHIPIPLTSFIGREKELQEIAELFSECRLITLTGSGGVGKTRLAIQVVADVLELFPDGVWFLDLAPLADPALLPNTLAEVLDLQQTGGSSLSIPELIISYLGTRTTLIIFDNCEHLIDSCAQLVDSLLKSCERLQILATSREALRVAGERTYRVPSLSVPVEPSTVDTLAKIESVQLFLERAKAVLPSLRLLENDVLPIAQICLRLDGIPLALELAAARVELLSVGQIAERLDDRFRLLTRGARTVLPRQQTMRAVIDWSYNLLSEEEQLLMQRLSVFVGGWTLDAAEAVCAEGDILDLLARLVDKSLVITNHEHVDKTRYHYLETIRQYAHEKLNQGEEVQQVRDQHLQYFLMLARRAEPQLYGARQIEWLQILEDENENMRAALEWALQRNVGAGQELAGALWWSWDLRGYLREGYEWLMKILDASSKNETLIRAKLFAGAAWLAGLLGYLDQKKALAEESFALYQKLEDKTGIAVPLITLASVASNQEADYAKAIRLLSESLELFRHSGNNWGVAFVLSMLGTVTETQRNFEQAHKYYQESLQIFKEIGDKDGSAWALYLMGGLASQEGDYAAAKELYEEALQIEKVVKSKLVTVWILTELGMLSIRSGDYDRSRLLLEEAIEMCRKTGNRAHMAYSLQSFGLVTRYQGDYPKARSLYKETLQLSHQLRKDADIAECLIGIGQLTGVQGSHEKFACLLGMAEGAVPDIQKMLVPFFRTETNKFIEMARAALGDEAYTAAWEAGRQMSLEEAVAYALKELQ